MFNGNNEKLKLKMIETNCVVEAKGKNNEQRQILEKQKLTLEGILNKMKRAVETNDAKLYNNSENYFLSLMGSSEYKKILPSQVKARFIREYHNLSVSNELLLNLVKLSELEEANNPYQLPQSISSFSQVVRDIGNRRRGSYKKTYGEYFPREHRISRVDIHSLKLALKGEY